MFHELGHALLKRDHKTTTLPNGEQASIMTPDPSMLYNEYTAKKRSYYFQELFEPNTIAPDWSLPKTNATIVLEDDIELTNEWQFKLSGSPNHVHEISTSVSDSPSSSLAITSLGVGGRIFLLDVFLHTDEYFRRVTTGSENKIKTGRCYWRRSYSHYSWRCYRRSVSCLYFQHTEPSSSNGHGR